MKKKCTECKQKKDFKRFDKKRSNKGGRDNICKECRVYKKPASKSSKVFRPVGAPKSINRAKSWYSK